jgi:hypothetical protein
MGIFSISDLVISLTLFINAAALLASRSRSSKISGLSASGSGEETSLLNDAGARNQHHEQRDAGITIRQRFDQLVDAIRLFSGVIVIWNVFFSVLVILVFRGS